MYYEEGKTECHHDLMGRSPALSWGMRCHSDASSAKHGMQVRAQWELPSRMALPSPCDAYEQFDLEKLLTAEDWTPAPRPGLPSWSCVDIKDDHRLLAYSFGPLPCMPPASTESTAPPDAASTAPPEGESTAPPTASSTAPAKNDSKGPTLLNVLWLLIAMLSFRAAENI
eukprot:500160-Amphidinium_carterae.2